MGTRGCIARRTEDGFEGRYHHFDSYPEGLGYTLHEIRNGYFGGDTAAMLRFLLDDHTAGWSSINGADFSEPPGYEEGGFKTNGPHCYCHGGRRDDEMVIRSDPAKQLDGLEYLYLFGQDPTKMEIYDHGWGTYWRENPRLTIDLDTPIEGQNCRFPEEEGEP